MCKSKIRGTNGDSHDRSRALEPEPIAVPLAHIPKIIELLKEKIAMGILEPSDAPYSNRWFMVPKKKRSLRFI